MPNNWPLVQLGELLTKSDDWISIRPDEKYRQVTVKLWGQGVVLRNEVTGAEIAARERLRVRGQQFILSRIDARNGALGLVPDFLDGGVVSSDFPVFTPNHERILSQFLNWMSKTAGFVDLCKAASEGTTNRVRLKEDKFLAFKIPLPALHEQRRIVARIEQLAAKNQEARGLRLQACEEADSILAGEELKIWPDAELGQARTLGEVTTFLARGRQSQQGPSDHFLIKTQHVQLGRYIPTQFTLVSHVANRVNPDAIARPHDVLIACSAAGCLGRVAVYTDAARKASTDTHVAIARARHDLVLPEYLYAYLRGAQGQRQLRSREKGDWQREKVGFRLTELNVADMRRVPVPVPPLAEQRRIVAYLDNLQAKVDALKKLQSETTAELDALLLSLLSKAFQGEL